MFREALQSRLEAAQSQIDEFTGRSERTESQLEKLVQVNSKLKRALQSFKDKVQRAVADRPYLFANVGEETGERLEHLITTVENQITQIDAIEAERSQMEEQLRDEIERLKENLFESNSERSSLRTRLDEMEVDLRNSLDDYASTLIRYETLVGDRYASIASAASVSHLSFQLQSGRARRTEQQSEGDGESTRQQSCTNSDCRRVSAIFLSSVNCSRCMFGL